MDDHRELPEYPGYRIHSTGEIVSLKHAEPATLSFSVTKKGYRIYQLWVGGKRLSRSGHRLVLEAFVGPRPEGLQARHLNSNPAVNRRENLCWGTAKENSADRDQAGHQWNAAKTHCYAGHEFTPENTKYFPSAPNHRVCIACRRAGDRERKRRERAR